jgi:hypothetical protein
MWAQIQGAMFLQEMGINTGAMSLEDVGKNTGCHVNSCTTSCKVVPYIFGLPV